MARRKSAAKPRPARRDEKPLTKFRCPFCNHPDSVECTIKFKEFMGTASCGICHEEFSTSVHALSEPIDVYADWIDACDRVNQP